jgi:hypothetical protein
MKYNLKNFFTFFTVIIVCFIIDISQFFLFSALFIPLLLCLYCTLLFYDVSITFLVITAFLQNLEAFCFYNNAFLPFIYLIPITIASYVIKKNLYRSFFYPTLLAIMSFILYVFIVERFILGIIKEMDYTYIQLCAIILVEICFSLTIKYWSMQDNRA